MTGSIVLFIVVLLVLFWGVGAYKRLVRLQNQVRKTFSQVDVQLKRRYDLVPNLVETAGGYMKDERAILEAAIEARNRAVGANAKAKADPGDRDAVCEMASADDALSVALGRMFALSESYPEAKTDENMAQLTEELDGAENRIAFAWQAYNDSVMQYNTSRAQFPSVIIAGMFAFKPAELLHSTEAQEARKPVKLPP